jgi:hypothetical protein
MPPRTSRSSRARRGAALATATALSACLLVGACGDGVGDGARSTGTTPDAGTVTDPASVERPPEVVQHLDIIGGEYTFEISPDPGLGLRPGWTSVTFHNAGEEAHQVMFARLKDGVDLGELARVAGGDSSGAAAIEYVDMLGGVSYIGPDNTITALVELPEGTVMAMCYVPDHDGIAHALLGMSTVLTVTPDTAPGSTSAPAASPPPAGDAPTTAPPPAAGEIRGTIELAGDGYHVPSSLPAGWYRVVNTDTAVPGKGLHELSILGLAQPASPDALEQLMVDLAGNATPAVELDAVGGLGALSPGFEGYLYLDLPPGDYVAVDFMPDPRAGRPHLLDGYYTAFRA